MGNLGPWTRRPCARCQVRLAASRRFLGGPGRQCLVGPSGSHARPSESAGSWLSWVLEDLAAKGPDTRTYQALLGVKDVRTPGMASQHGILAWHGIRACILAWNS